jgi:hypothetical protein
MWTLFRDHYEPTAQSTFLAAIHHEQLLRQCDATIDAFFNQLSIVWCRIDTLVTQLSPATYQSCKDQKTSLKLHHMYDFLTRLRDEYKPLRAQLLARHPYLSLVS